MDRIIRRSAFIPILCIFTARLLSGGASPVAGQKITKENGVEVIHNPKDPIPIKGVPSTPVLREDLVIGAEGGDANYVFTRLGMIVVNGNGDIYALDPRALQIRRFDGEGRFLGQFGRAGQGPGELQLPYLIAVAPDGRIVLGDAGNRRLSLFSPIGEFLMDLVIGNRMVQNLVFDDSGFAYGNFLEDVDEKNEVEKLVKFDSAMKTVATIAEFKMIFRPGTLVEYTGDRTFVQVVQSNTLIWARRGQYEFTVVGKDGRVIRKIRKDYRPIKITQQIKKDRLQALFKGNVPGDVTVVFPDHFPPMRQFIADPDGRLYVRTYEKDKNGYEMYDVLDPEGRYTARLRLPPTEVIEVARKDKLYCLIEANEDGIPQIKRYSLSWK